MNNYQIRKARKRDLEEILALQQKAHFRNVSDLEKEKEGFVSVETSIQQLRELNERVGILVATSDGRVVGYEMPLDLEIANEITLLKPFTDRILGINYRGRKLENYKWIIEGQINIDVGHKGKGIAERLHSRFVSMLRKKGYEVIVTEISDQNPRSLHVHTEKLGLEVVQQYSAEGRNWYVLMQDIRN